MKRTLAHLLIAATLAIAAPPPPPHSEHGHQPPPPKQPPPSSNTIPYSVALDPAIWLVEHINIPTTQANLVNGALVFPIQQYGVAWNNYFDWEPWLNKQSKGHSNSPTSINVSTAKTLTVVVRIQTTGQPTWRYDSNPDNTCVYPAHLRPYIAVGEDSARYNDTGRWWSNSASPGTNIDLSQLPANADITYTLVMDLTDPSQWSDVIGQYGNLNASTISQFAATKTALGEMGFTLGGGCFFGHGVSVQNGTATMSLIRYEFD